MAEPKIDDIQAKKYPPERKDGRMTIMERKLATTISEEYFARSPETQAFAKAHNGNSTPTSHGKGRRRSTVVGSEEYTNEMKYKESSAHDREMMIQYGLIHPTSEIIRMRSLGVADWPSEKKAD